MLAALASAMRYAEPGAAPRTRGAALMLTWLSITTHCHAHKAEYGGTTPQWRCCKELALARQDCPSNLNGRGAAMCCKHVSMDRCKLRQLLHDDEQQAACTNAPRMKQTKAAIVAIVDGSN